MSSKQIATIRAGVLMLCVFSLAQSQSGQAPASSAAQDKTSKQKPVSSGDDPVRTIVLPSGETPMAVPDGASAWAVQVNAGGGFGGIRSDSLTVTSAGEVTCNGAKSAAGNLLPTNLGILSQLVVAVRPDVIRSDQAALRPNSLCSDCYNTTLMLSRREANDKVKTYVTSWDTVTRARVPKDLGELYETVMRLAACQ